jgi:hypothetical protein
MGLKDAYYSDPDYLNRLGVDVMAPVPFNYVIPWMSKAMISPVLSRPTFYDMKLVSPRMFETPAASTIPLFALDETHVQEIYGERALELVLPDQHPQEKILDMLHRPEHYAKVVLGVREHLAKHHSAEARLKALIDIIKS